MTRNIPPSRRPGGRGLSLWLLCALIVAGTATSAGTKQDAPEGLPAGPVVFRPWFGTDILGDDNLFRRNESANPESDVESIARAGVTASVPFRMSELQLGYQGGAFFYREDNVEDSETHAGTLLLDLEFSSFNSFKLDGSYSRGVTQRQDIDQNTGEIVRQGIPLIRNNWVVEWSREVPQRPSWTAQLARATQHYNTVETQPWVDYEGWDIDYDYGQPIYRRGYLSANYSARRQDQFQSGSNSILVDPLRSEYYDGLELGFRGLVGRNQPLYVSLGYGKLQYKDLNKNLNLILPSGTSFGPPVNFSGLVGNARWNLPVGGRSNFRVSASRRPLSSFYNTYYLINEIRVQFDRRLAQATRLGVTTLLSRNRYGAPAQLTITGFTTQSCLTGSTPDTDIIRKDSRQQIEGFWEWLIQPRMTMRMTAGHNRRDTNCDTGFGSYVSNSVGLTFRLGWFD